MTGNFCPTSRYAHYKLTGNCLSSCSGGTSTGVVLFPFNSDVISKTSIGYSFLLDSLSGPLMIPSFSSTSSFNLPNSCSKMLLLLSIFLWIMFYQIEIIEQSTTSSSRHYNSFNTLNTNFCPLNLIINSPLLTYIKVLTVARNGLPNKMWVSSSALKSIMIKSAGHTNLSTLTNTSSILL